MMTRIVDSFSKGLKSIRSHPRVTLFSIAGLALILIGAGLSLSFYFDLQDSQPVTIAPLAKHADISKRAMESFSQSLSTSLPRDVLAPSAGACKNNPTRSIALENQNSGVKMTMKSWHNLDLANPRGSVLWLDQSSVACGQTVAIKASAHLSYVAPKGPRTFEALRIGWYGGTGARLVWKSSPINLKDQKIPVVKNVERMVETRWKTTLRFTVGKDWTPGFYLIASVSPRGAIESVAPLIVRSPLGTSRLLLVHSTMTWAAYNTYGGRSLYLGPGGSIVGRRIERSRVVSFDRPLEGSGALHLDRDAITLVQFIEMQGINFDQVSDVNLDQSPSISTHYSGIVFSGHAEYFTRRMFDTITADRNLGINLAFLGANNAYWQTRLDSSPIGPNRHVIVYRSSTADPVTARTQVSVKFQDPHVNTPPNMLTGTLTSGVHAYGNLHAVDIPKWLKIPLNSQINGVSGDSEIDATVRNVAQPPNVHVLFTGKLEFRDTPGTAEEEQSKFEKIPIQQSVWFTTPSGSAVFDAGLTTWTCNLLPSCVSHSVDSSSEAVLQNVTTQVLTMWQQRGVGRTLK
ncbi:MAG TPA: N,N-dimethylformamidase beta subunit family domain-containing protein [Candidatus Nanopelagicaceae bacterium]|jgi:hypothetical protein